MVAALQRAEVDYTRRCTADVVVGIATQYGLDGLGIESTFCAVQNSFEIHPYFSGMDTTVFEWVGAILLFPPPYANHGVTCNITTNSTYLTV